MSDNGVWGAFEPSAVGWRLMLIVGTGPRVAMKILILLVAAVGVGLMIWLPQRLHARKETHDAVEYYRQWGAYQDPIRLYDKITREEADALAAAGSAYLIGYFDADGKRMRVVKMLRGSIFFDQVYAYYASGKLKGVKTTNSDGTVIVREYSESDRAGFFW
jgi:hypothetical protein